jgi:large conductance mechanosensitive channel
MKNTLKEFKEFISAGNLVDLAVAFILAISVKAVIDSFINGIVLNLIAAIVGEPNFDSIVIGVGESDILIGTFITAVVNLLIIGAVLFAVVKVMAKFKKENEEAGVDTEISLLTEIRDSLKK